MIRRYRRQIIFVFSLFLAIHLIILADLVSAQTQKAGQTGTPTGDLSPEEIDTHVAGMTDEEIRRAYTEKLKIETGSKAASLRLFPMEDRDAAFLYKWILRIIFIAGLFAGIGAIFQQFGVSDQLYFRMYSSSGLVVILAMVIMVWQSRNRVAQAICDEDMAACGGTLRTAFSRNWHYLAIVYVIVAGGIWTAKALNGENVTVLNLILSIFLIPIVIGVDQWVQRLLKIASGEARETIDLSGEEPMKIEERAQARVRWISPTTCR